MNAHVLQVRHSSSRFCRALLPLGSAQAADGDVMANLRPVALNESTASGTAIVQVNGNKIDVTMADTGLLAVSPPAACIHSAPTPGTSAPTAPAPRPGRKSRPTRSPKGGSAPTEFLP